MHRLDADCLDLNTQVLEKINSLRVIRFYHPEELCNHIFSSISHGQVDLLLLFMYAK